MRKASGWGGQGGVLIIIWGLLALLRGPETETSKELGYNSLFLGQYFFIFIL